jgi:two-component system, NtrC family, response regulator GlrR
MRADRMTDGGFGVSSGERSVETPLAGQTEGKNQGAAFHMNTRKILLLSCIISGESRAFEELLRRSFGAGAEVRNQAANCCNSNDDVRSIWQMASRFDPNLVFLLGGSSSFDRIASVLIVGRKLAVSPIIVAIDQARPTDFWRCLEMGADDFLVQPWRTEEILPRAWRMIGVNSGRSTTAPREDSGNGLDKFVGSCAKFRSELDRAIQVSEFDVGVLILGESGTGKEMVARAIHDRSPRAGKPFVPVNCGAIPGELVENELFGHERGAYTGAVAAQAGIIAEAEGGTVFLDEIGCLTLHAQAKLLRFLQSHEFRPLGSSKSRTADVRIIAATNSELDRAVRDGRFRADLYYRLNVVPLVLPPLRDRREDIPLLVNHFSRKYASHFSKPVVGIAPDAMHKITSYDWPGNVRELENTIQRAVVLSLRSRLVASDIDLPPTNSPIPESFQQRKQNFVTQFERTRIEELLAAYQGNISQAAAAARKNRRAFWQLIRKHKIDVVRFRRPKTSMSG